MYRESPPTGSLLNGGGPGTSFRYMWIPLAVPCAWWDKIFLVIIVFLAVWVADEVTPAIARCPQGRQGQLPLAWSKIRLGGGTLDEQNGFFWQLRVPEG